MKKSLLNNFGLKLLSFIFAVILWLIVVNVENPVTTKEFSNVKVKVINENVLDSINKVYEVVEGDTVNFTVQGKRTEIDKLREKDFVVTADLSKLSMVNAAPIEVEPLRYKSEVKITSVKSDTLKVKLEDEATESFPITVVTKGEVERNYAIGEKTTTPNIVKLSGPKSLIKKIDSVKINVDVDGASSKIKTTCGLKYYNVDGDEINSDRIQCSNPNVTAIVEVLNTTEVPVEVSTVGRVTNGYMVSSLNYEPKKLAVAGEKEKLEQLSVIRINDIDISGLTSTKECSIKVSDYLPEGVISKEEADTIMVTITIEKITDKTLVLSSKDIKLNGEKPGFTYEIEDTPKTIYTSGAQSVINTLGIADLEPAIDVSQYGKGTYYLPVTLKSIDDVQVSLNRKIKVKIKAK